MAYSYYNINTIVKIIFSNTEVIFAIIKKITDSRLRIADDNRFCIIGKTKRACVVQFDDTIPPIFFKRMAVELIQASSNYCDIEYSFDCLQVSFFADKAGYDNFEKNYVGTDSIQYNMGYLRCKLFFDIFKKAVQEKSGDKIRELYASLDTVRYAHV
jgi:hypothetical protein